MPYGREQYREAAKRRACWRRLFLVFGDDRLRGLAELLVSGSKPGGLVTPTHASVCAILDIRPRWCERLFADLVRLGWLKRVGARACNGIAQTYQLCTPSEITPELIARAMIPTRGVFVTLQELSTARRRRPGCHSLKPGLLGREARSIDARSPASQTGPLVLPDVSQ